MSAAPLCAVCAMPFSPYTDGHAWLCGDCQTLTPEERELAAKTARPPWPGEAGPRAEALRRAMVEEHRGKRESMLDATRHYLAAEREETERQIAALADEEAR